MKEFASFMQAKHDDILSEIRDNPKNKIKGDIEDRLKAALKSFTEQFEGKKVEM